MAWERFRSIDLEYCEDEKKPYAVTAWCNVGGVEVGDRFSKEVGDVLIEALGEDGITINVEVKP